MKKYSEKERASIALFIVCWLTYMTVCITKLNYTASIAYVVREGIFTKSGSGLISACFYLAYGVSQLLGGRLADRFSPYKVMASGILSSICTHLLLCFTNQFSHVLVLWGMTGLLQFGIWPSASRIIATVLIPEHRQKASLYITFGIAAAGLFSYLTVNSFLEAFGWSGVFSFNVLLLVLVLVVWLITARKTAPVLMGENGEGTEGKTQTTVPESPSLSPAPQKNKHRFLPLFFASGLFLSMFLCFAQGMLDNGVKSWMPTMMMENYEISPTWASMQTAVLYVCNIFGVLLLAKLFSRVKNAVLCGTIYYILCLPMCILMVFIGKIPLALVFVALMLSTTLTYTMTSIMVRISNGFARYGYSGTVSGFLNALTCFGIVIASYLYGYLADASGWGAVTALWVIICALAIVCGGVGFLFWRKFLQREE